MRGDKPKNKIKKRIETQRRNMKKKKDIEIRYDRGYVNTSVVSQIISFHSKDKHIRAVHFL